MTLLIFKSEVTKAVYAWNGNEVVTIVGTPDRPVGKIMMGFVEVDFPSVIASGKDHFFVGNAKYFILSTLSITF